MTEKTLKRYLQFLLIVIYVSLTACSENNPVKPQLSVDDLYHNAVLDAMVIDDDEILPLVEISPQSPFCTWDSQGRILLITYHRFPGSYIPNEDYKLIYGEVWTFTDKEIINWFENNEIGVTDWELRFKQLIGLPPHRDYTHFSALWTNIEDVVRPAYAWKLSDNFGAKTFIDPPNPEFKTWFDNNILWSYFESAFPWTRLGYTYDWANNRKKYGLSEFLIKKDATVHVEFTLNTEEFLTWLRSQKIII